MSNDRLKFRAWDKWRKKMITPNDGDFIGWHAMSNWRDCLEVMQWTERYDRNDSPVYDGDFVKSGMTGALYLVFWSDEHSGWYKEMIDANVSDRPIYQDSSSDYVVGNIYENPELRPRFDGAGQWLTK